jgi:hypothetical protein
MGRSQRRTKITYAEFRAWMDDEADLIDDAAEWSIKAQFDDPAMGEHFSTCEECKDWSDVEIDMLESERLPGLDLLTQEERERLAFLLIKMQTPPRLH